MTAGIPSGELLRFAHQLADCSAAAIMPHFRSTMMIENKGSGGGPDRFDPVTIADRSAETAMRDLIAHEYPSHGIVGEEFGRSANAAGHRWILDPIDGTRAFMMGLPTWGTLIGLANDNQPMLGVMNQPFTGERFFSDGQKSCYRRGTAEQPLKTRSCATLSDAVLSATSPAIFKTESTWTRFLAISQRTKMTRYGGDCYSYCLVAAGHVDIVIESSLETYDVAALIPIVEAAGGRMTTWDGGSALDGGDVVACGDPRLHEQLVELLAG